MQNEVVKRDIRALKVAVWWRKWDVMFYMLGMLLMGILVGSVSASFADRAERIETARRHDDEIRQFRMDCRNVVDAESRKVRDMSAAVTQITEAAAASGDTPAVRPVPVPKPAVKRSPPVNLEEAVTRANAQIKEGRR